MTNAFDLMDYEKKVGEQKERKKVKYKNQL